MPRPDVEIRNLHLQEVMRLADILDQNNSWKQLMAIIPSNLEDDNCSSFKYSMDDFQKIEEAKEVQRRSCTSILIEEWGTSGKVRPRLSTLRQLLVKAELYRAADCVSELLNVPPPERPERGPAASVPIPNADQLPVPNKNPLPKSVPSFLKPSPQGHLELCLTQLPEVPNETTQPDTNIQNLHVEENEVLPITYKALAGITNNFDETKCLGKGACGSVYLGTANSGTRKIAIKRLHKEGVPGGADKQFRNEIAAISKIIHPNLLTLLGFSTDGESFCLIYPYMSNGSLYDMLINEEGRKRLDWRLRLDISLGAARGISHLHGLEPRPLIHRDIKTANVLLDDNMIPKLCDFGLVRASSDDKTLTTALTTTIIGTSAYMAYEVFKGEISVKMDVYSFGVVLLELLTGLPAMGDEGSLADTIYAKIGSSELSESLMDELVDNLAGDWRSDISRKYLDVALNCIDDKIKRPHITTVVEQIEKIIIET